MDDVLLLVVAAAFALSVVLLGIGCCCGVVWLGGKIARGIAS